MKEEVELVPSEGRVTEVEETARAKAQMGRGVACSRNSKDARGARAESTDWRKAQERV